MGQERFKSTTGNSFFGDFLYEQVLPRGHFLAKLKELVPWQRFTYKLVKYHRGRAKEGHPPYDPAVVLKMLPLSFLYNVSERQVEDLCNLYLPAKYFLGLGVDERPPDHTTLTAFKRRVLENGKLTAFENLLGDIVQVAREQGITFGPLQIMDSTHSEANVSVSKDDARRKRGEPPRDGNAKWGVKRSYKKKDGSRGKVHFFGYKTHMSLNAESGLITSLILTPGNAHDGTQLPKLLQRDLAQGLEVGTVTADRGYDDSDNHCLLWTHGVHSAIVLNDYRTQKKDASKSLWLQMQQRPEYREGVRQRYKIEAKFGEAKTLHGLRRCRYVGLLRYAIQSYLTAVVLNLKRLVMLLAGVSLRSGLRAMT